MHKSALWILVFAVLSGCAALQGEASRQGETCSPELDAVSKDVADLEGVVSLDRVWRFSTVDKGSAGGIEVIADVRERGDAALPASAYQRGDQEPVERVTVVVATHSQLGTEPLVETTTTSPGQPDPEPCSDSG